ncbi:MAG: cytidine deaminase [Candidatus Gastranaerophilales bacterium]|nr:cytidine deaminase [Candidatus Gastranaerophilales bacterium]
MDIFGNLLEDAKKASKHSYSPYSKFSVGASILYESGEIYTGCNVENASYGLSLCAERNAMASAIAKGETSKIKAIAIYSPNQTLCMPCGACRQWLSEFCINEQETKIVLEDKNYSVLVLNLGDIFPYGFKFDEKQ